MKSLRSGLAISMLAVCLAAPAIAQGFLEPYMTADHSMRASRVIGMPVYNEHNEKLGTIEDITLPAMGGEVTAILSVGGFLGVGQKLIKVPLSHVHFDNGKPMMPADKAMLMAMPSYTYTGGGGG